MVLFFSVHGSIVIFCLTFIKSKYSFDPSMFFTVNCIILCRNA